jgi:hypothetical protein
MPAGTDAGAVPRLISDGLAAVPWLGHHCPALRGGSKCRRLLIAVVTTHFIQDSQAMLRWFYVALHLLFEAGAARRDARIRSLKAQVEIFRRKLGGNRVIPSPEDRARLLAIGQELNHNVADVIGIVTPQTYCRWVEELREGRRPKRVGRPKIARNLRELAIRLAKENAGWGYRRIIVDRTCTEWPPYHPRTRG